jgi:hypothetical protein
MMRSRFALAIALCASLAVALAPSGAHAAPSAPTRALADSWAILVSAAVPTRPSRGTIRWCGLSCVMPGLSPRLGATP